MILSDKVIPLPQLCHSTMSLFSPSAAGPLSPPFEKQENGVVESFVVIILIICPAAKSKQNRLRQSSSGSDNGNCQKAELRRQGVHVHLNLYFPKNFLRSCY